MAQDGTSVMHSTSWQGSKYNRAWKPLRMNQGFHNGWISLVIATSSCGTGRSVYNVYMAADANSRNE